MISLIAAIGRNNELGKQGKLLWSLPAYTEHFKQITSGHKVIMAQKNFKPIKTQGEEVFIIGGAEIYEQAIHFANKLYITHIDAEDKKADSFFPEIIPIVWNEVSHEEHKKNSKNLFNYTFSVYEKFI